MKIFIFACTFLILPFLVNAQMNEGRKYRQLIESDTLAFSTLLAGDSTFLAYRITDKAAQMRFYKYNDSAATIVLLTEDYSMPLRVKFINDDGNKVYEPKYITCISI